CWRAPAPGATPSTGLASGRNISGADLGLHRAPDALGRRRHLDVTHAEFGKRVDHSVDHGRQRADAAGFTHALDAERVGLGRNRVGLDLHVAEVVRVRHGVIHERGGYQLAGRVEVNVLHQRLACALRDAALNLAVHQQRVDDRADVVDDAVAYDLHLAGFAVDLQFADMDAVRVVGDWRAVHRGGRQARLHALGEVFGIERGGRQLLDRQRAVGLAGGKDALLEAQLVGLNLQHVR